MRVHALKTWPKYYKAIEDGEKTFEYRNNKDRDFRKGDTLLLQEYDPKSGYTGHEMKVTVTYVLKDIMGLPEDYAVLSIEKE